LKKHFTLNVKTSLKNENWEFYKENFYHSYDANDLSYQFFVASMNNDAIFHTSKKDERMKK
jgi:hypothetical protein